MSPSKSAATPATAKRQRALQSKADKANDKNPDYKGEKKPVQAGVRRQPEPPLPAQRLDKPGREADLEPAPRYRAPDYRGSGKLKGMSRCST